MTLQDICTIVSVTLGVKNVTGDQVFQVDLAAQSLDLLNIVVAIENKYGVYIEDSELADILTVSDLYQLAKNRDAA